MAESFESTRTNEKFREIDAIVLAHPEIKQLLYCRISLQEQQIVLSKEIEKIKSAKEGDFVDPIKQLQLVNVLIPKNKTDFEENSNCLIQYINQNRIEVDIPTLMEYIIFSIKNSTISDNPEPSHPIESQTKWYQFCKRFQNWKKRNN